MTFNNAIRLAAETIHIPLVSVYDLSNGVNHDESPREKVYIRNDRFFLSTESAMAMVNLLRAAGYEPLEP